MKPNQTSTTGGIQNILIPMQDFKCTQGDFEGNHPYYACDMAGKDTGRDLFYAPFDVVCKATNPKDGNAVWWQSVNKVRFADGTIDYATIMIIHDNNLSGIYAGATYKQGQQIAQEGTAGKATGNHIHFEIAKGAFTRQYAQNTKGYYLPNGMAIEKACFADGTNFLTSGSWDWKYTKDVAVSEPEQAPATPSAPVEGLTFIKENGTFTLTVDKINFRNAPTTTAPVEGFYTKGQSVNYDGYVRNEDKVWIHWISASKGTDRWMACRVVSTNEPWGTFSA